MKNCLVLLFVSCLLMILLNFQPNLSIFSQAQKSLDQNNIIELTANKVGESYVWKNSELGFNPSFNFKANTSYTFLINSFQNDTAEHELIIEPKEGGEHLAESEEIEHGSSSEFVFNTGTSQILKYYCEYHPDSMVGMINVTALN